MSLALQSSAFAHHTDMPKKTTCEGDDISPALHWSGVPVQAKGLVLIVDDPDAPDPTAPRMTWVHWLLYNIPPTVFSLPEHTTSDNLPEGALEGVNDWKQTGYRGPCPPKGRHRYFFKLYAMDAVLPDLQMPDKSRLEKAMTGHVLTKTELIGTYLRQ